MRPTHYLLALFVLTMALGEPAQAGKPGSSTRVYKIAQAHPYPPWDVGPLEGVSIDVTQAICEANAPMKCKFTPVASEQCFDTDDEGQPFVGPGLASGRFDGCLTWFRTAAREQLGAEFAHGYSTGPTAQLIASDTNPVFDGLGGSGSLGGAVVAFFAGFFSDAGCLSSQYSDFEAITSPSDEASRDLLVTDLQDGVIDLIFWDNPSTVPDGTKLVGEAIPSCGPDLQGLAVYPPSTSRKPKSDALRRDFNCGLALIRASGELEAICSSSPHPGGDPACVLEGPPPTEQCLQDNPATP